MKAIRPIILLLISANVAAYGDDGDGDKKRNPNKERRARMQANAGRILDGLKNMGSWDEHYGYMMDSMEKVYDRYGFDSEPDQFSLDLVAEVEAIPPWNIPQRFNKMTEMFSDRYLLDEQQEQKLRRIITRESMRIFGRHSDRIVQYATDFIQTRAAGEAITPEHVSRWMELAEPVFEFAQMRMNAAAEQFMKELDPEQRELLRQDLEAGNRRITSIEKLSAKWRRGQWKPEDWGMEDDPIQVAGQRRLASLAGLAEKADDRTGSVERELRDEHAARAAVIAAAEREDDGTPARVRSRRDSRPKRISKVGGQVSQDDWDRYLTAFIGKFTLNEAQQTRSRSILSDVKKRRDRLRKRVTKKKELLLVKLDKGGDDAVKSVKAELSRLNEPLARLFGQFKRRIGRLPTRAQRRDAGKQELSEPADARG